MDIYGFLVRFDYTTGDMDSLQCMSPPEMFAEEESCLYNVETVDGTSMVVVGVIATTSEQAEEVGYRLIDHWLTVTLEKE